MISEGGSVERKNVYAFLINLAKVIPINFGFFTVVVLS